MTILKSLPRRILRYVPDIPVDADLSVLVLVGAAVSSVLPVFAVLVVVVHVVVVAAVVVVVVVVFVVVDVFTK